MSKIIKITKSQKEYLIKQGLLKLEYGQYTGLYIANRNHNSNSKTFFVQNHLSKYLKNVL